MNYLDILKVGKAQEVREYVKQNSTDENFISYSIENKEEIVPLLLKNKTFPELLMARFLDKGSDLIWLLDQFIENQFTPDLTFIDALTKQTNVSDQVILNAIKAFPSIPFSTQFLFRMINEGFLDSAIELVKIKKDFQKTDILILLLRRRSNDGLIRSLALDSEECRKVIANDIKEKDFCYSVDVIGDVVLRSKEKDLISLTDAVKLGLKSEVLGPLFVEFKIKSAQERNHYGYSSRRADHTQIEWSSVLENDEMEEQVDICNCLVINAPPNSRYRLAFIKSNPGKADDQELIDLASSHFINKYVAQEIVRRPIYVIKKIGVDKIEDQISPGELVNNIGGDLEKKLYYFDEIGSKFKAALRKVIPLEKISAEKNIRKKSYFFEAFTAIKTSKVEDFRLALSHGYSIDKFFSDCRQSSKQRSCEMVGISLNFLVLLNKEEFLFFNQSPFSLRAYYGDDESLNFKFSLNLEESLMVLDKMNADTALQLVSDKVSFILNSNVSNQDVLSIYKNKTQMFLTDQKLMEAYIVRLSRMVSGDISLESLQDVAKILPRSKLSHLKLTTHYEATNFINLKCADGLYLLDDSQILEIIENKYALESRHFIDQVMIRDKVLAQKIVEAYLKGNKAMSDLCGKPIKIWRGKKDLFIKATAEVNQDTKTIVDSIFANGGKLESFKSDLLDWTRALQDYGADRTVFADSLNLNDIYEFAELTQIRLNIGRLLADCNSYASNKEIVHPDRFLINSMVIGSDGYRNEVPFDLIKKAIQIFGIKYIQINNLKLNTKIDLIKNGILFNNFSDSINQEVSDINGGKYDSVADLGIEDLIFLEDYGLVFSHDLVLHLISSSRNLDVAQWLGSRIGNLKTFIFRKDNFYGDDMEIVLKKMGASVLEETDYQLSQIDLKLRSSGPSFEEIDVSSFSLENKNKIIKMIESIDPRYSQLDLNSSNLETLEVLAPYSLMKKLTIDDDSIIALLEIPENITKNKKILKGIKDLLSIKGIGISYKIELLRTSFEILNPSIKLGFSDFIDYSNPSDVVEENAFANITVGVIQAIIDNQSAIKKQNIVLKNKEKSSIFRFLKTAAAKDSRYINDIFSMIEQVNRGLDGLRDRLTTLKSMDESTAVQELENSINLIYQRLVEVSGIDDAEKMHDRLVPLLEFIKTDPAQPLGQDKFSKLESAKATEQELGFNLFFPKTRGDLIELGSIHGWCVSTHRGYGDGVISNGNILVALCEKDKPISIESVIALAHFQNHKNGLYLEQLKWSSKKQNGNRNVDATKSFNHNKILALINDHLKSRES
jgi:hypothetical protein